MAFEKSGKEPLLAARGVVAKVQKAWGESPFNQAGLKGPAPDRLLFQPVDPRAPDRGLAETLRRGRVSLGAETLDCEPEPLRLWDAAANPGPLHAFLHGFEWLRHCEALGESGGEFARDMARGWLDRCEKWAPVAWTPSLTSERLVNLCAGSAIVLRGGDAMWRSRLLTSMARQTRHLARAGHRAETGYERLMTAAGLTLAALALPGCDEEAERGIELLRRELRLQIRPDGGHIGRNPSHQLALVVRLQMIMRAHEARKLAPPAFLKHTVGRAAGNVQFFRCGDGRLAVFNGGYEDDAKSVLAAADAVDADFAPTGFAPHSGFQRLEAGRSLAIIDASAQPGPLRFDSAGSLHFSSGRARIVVNCGNGGHLPGDWPRAMTQPAAHSSLSVEPALSAAGLFAGALVHRRAEDGRGQLLEIERAFDEDERGGPRYVRRIFLSVAGDTLRGEDRFFSAPQALAAGWRLRFHLHPDVKALPVRDGQSIILSLPTKEGWRFRSNAPAVRLERSVYLGRGQMPTPCEQIVLTGVGLEADPPRDMLIKWAFQRLDGAWSPDDRTGSS